MRDPVQSDPGRTSRWTNPICHGRIRAAHRGRILKRSPLFVALFTVFVDLIGFGVIVPFLLFYAKGVGGDGAPAILGALLAVFFAMQFVFSPILGRLSDRVGRRPVILGTLVLATAGHLTLSVAGSSIVLLFAARILAGIGSGNLSVAQAYVADRTRPEERARGMGLIGAAFGVGFAVGPLIGGVLQPYGLAAPALAAAALAAVNFGLAFLFLPESLTAKVRKENGKTGPAKFGEVARRPALRALLVTFVVVSFAFSAVPVAFPSLGNDFFGLGEQQIALIFIYIGVINLIVGYAAGRLARRFGTERLVAFGTVAIMVGLALVPLAQHLSAYVLLTGIVAMGVAIAFPLIPSLVSKRTVPQEQGAVLGVAQSLGSLARVPGPLVAGFLYDEVSPASPFLFGAALMALGFAMTLLVYRESRRGIGSPSAVSASPWK
jgi:MFS transporter, DHA1 family, tetracycline resistance protein